VNANIPANFIDVTFEVKENKMKRGNTSKSLTERSQRIREYNLKTTKVKARFRLQIRVVSL